VPSTGELLSDSMEEATSQCIRNAQAILQAAGLDLNNVVKASVFLTTMDDYAAMDSAYRKAMPQPFPAREAVAVQGLPKGARVEISMIAQKV
jgi:2-iminobutanoate/2-iminopropanoate deaminase